MSKHKSSLGTRPGLAEPPPVAPGKPWWTSPPVSAPDPSHLAWAKLYRAELAAQVVQLQAEVAEAREFVNPSRKYLDLKKRLADVNSMLIMINAWIKAANVFAVSTEAYPQDIQTIDGLLVEVMKLVWDLMKKSGTKYQDLDPWQKMVKQAGERRAQKIMAERSGRGR